MTTSKITDLKQDLHDRETERLAKEYQEKRKQQLKDQEEAEVARREMESKTIKVKRLSNDAVVPTRVHNNDAGWDLYAAEDVIINAGERCLVSTDISFEIPDGYVGLIWPRSGLAAKNGIDILAGVIDAGYRGEISVCLYNSSSSNLVSSSVNKKKIWKLNTEENAIHIKKGDRVAQILFQEIPEVYLVEVDNLNNSERSAGGFGSSGK